jgi:hypothetical protein
MRAHSLTEANADKDGEIDRHRAVFFIRRGEVIILKMLLDVPFESTRSKGSLSTI